MDLENKVIGFQFEPERSISNHKGFFQDSSDEGDAMERDMFDRKDCDPSVWCKCRNCSTMKTEKECLCCQEVETVRDFIFISRYICLESSNSLIGITEAVTRRCSVEKVFLEILRNFVTAPGINT